MFNMSALLSFGSWMIDAVLGREQFLALYVTAGTISSLASLRFASLLPPHIEGSLGASGSIFGLFGIAANFPDIMVDMGLFPGLKVPADVAFWATMAWELFCLMTGAAREFDHAAHLAGGLFGFVYFRFLKPYLWDKRRSYLRKLGYQ